MGLYPETMEEGVRPAIHEIAADLGLQCIDLKEVFNDSSYCIDGVHPQRKGTRMIADNAEVELKKIELICQVGMTFLQSISDKLSQKGFSCYVTRDFDNETAKLHIEYGNGISCKYKINLLDNFQEKILEITNRL
jgi:hypothetical protein